MRRTLLPFLLLACACAAQQAPSKPVPPPAPNQAAIKLDAADALAIATEQRDILQSEQRVMQAELQLQQYAAQVQQMEAQAKAEQDSAQTRENADIEAARTHSKAPEGKYTFDAKALEFVPVPSPPAKPNK